MSLTFNAYQGMTVGSNSPNTCGYPSTCSNASENDNAWGYGYDATGRQTQAAFSPGPGNSNGNLYPYTNTKAYLERVVSGMLSVLSLIIPGGAEGKGAEAGAIAGTAALRSAAPAASAKAGLQLTKSLASESQMANALRGIGKPIAGAGTNTTPKGGREPLSTVWRRSERLGKK